MFKNTLRTCPRKVLNDGRGYVPVIAQKWAMPQNKYFQVSTGFQPVNSAAIPVQHSNQLSYNAKVEEGPSMPLRGVQQLWRLKLYRGL